MFCGRIFIRYVLRGENSQASECETGTFGFKRDGCCYRTLLPIDAGAAGFRKFSTQKVGESPNSNRSLWAGVFGGRKTALRSQRRSFITRLSPTFGNLRREPGTTRLQRRSTHRCEFPTSCESGESQSVRPGSSARAQWPTLRFRGLGVRVRTPGALNAKKADGLPRRPLHFTRAQEKTNRRSCPLLRALPQPWAQPGRCRRSVPARGRALPSTLARGKASPCARPRRSA